MIELGSRDQQPTVLTIILGTRGSLLSRPIGRKAQGLIESPRTDRPNAMHDYLFKRYYTCVRKVRLV